MTGFVLVVMLMPVIAALAALRQRSTQGLDSRPAEVPARDQEGTRAGAGWEDTKPAPVPEAFSDAPRTAALRLVRSPRQDVTQPTLDDAMAEWDAEWLWPPSPDNAA